MQKLVKQIRYKTYETDLHSPSAIIVTTKIGIILFVSDRLFQKLQRKVNKKSREYHSHKPRHKEEEKKDKQCKSAFKRKNTI